MSDIRLEDSFRTHPKRVKLQRKLGPEGVLSFVDLLLGVGEYKCSGDLSGWTEEDISIVSGYQGDIHLFIETLLELGLLDEDNGALRIHEWPEHQPWAVGAEDRRKAAIKAARARWDKKPNSIKSNEHARDCEPQCNPRADRNAPNLTLPIPTLPSKENTSSEVSHKAPDSNLSEGVRLSQFLFSRMLLNNPKAKKPNFESWAKHVGLMLRVEKRTTQEIEDVIEFSQGDDFWKVNILSTSKLREKFDQLYLKMKQQQRPSSSAKTKQDSAVDHRNICTVCRKPAPFISGGKCKACLSEGGMSDAAR
jgi:hypothetical protein